jgi:SAM-dependent methyltransferase
VSERALSFGTVAARYERYRPDYPDDLVDAVLAYAGRPLGAALEIGAGTGKATRVFASRGIAVTATDPDPAMLRELRKHVPQAVVTEQRAFEDLPLQAAYDLVFAAASLHWTEPEHRWARVASMLRPNGVFASFGGPAQLADDDLEAAVREARSAIVPVDDVPSPDGTPASSALQWPGTELARSDLLGDVQQLSMDRRLVWSSSDYLGYLSTVSAYLQLPTTARAEVFARIRRVLPARVEVVADITAHLARRLTSAW